MTSEGEDPEVRNLPPQVSVGKQRFNSLASLTGISGQAGKAGLLCPLGKIRNRLTMALPNRSLFLFTRILERESCWHLLGQMITGFMDLLAFSSGKTWLLMVQALHPQSRRER